MKNETKLPANALDRFLISATGPKFRPGVSITKPRLNGIGNNGISWPKDYEKELSPGLLIPKSSVSCKKVSNEKSALQSSRAKSELNATFGRSVSWGKVLNIGNMYKDHPYGSIFGPIIPEKNSEILASKILTEVEKQITALGEPQEGYDYCLENEYFHPYRGVRRERIVLKPCPKTAFDPVETIRKPEEMRELLRHEVSKQAAEIRIQGAHAETLKREKTIKLLFKKGILGFDSPENPNSIYYKNESEKFLQLEQLEKEHERNRSAIVSSKTDTTHLIPLKMLSPRFETKFSKLLPLKKRVTPSNEAYLTSSFERIFHRETGVEFCRKRRVEDQLMRQHKPFDIITNCTTNPEILT